MKKIVLSAIVGAALMASTVSGAFAADHSQPGTPGTPNCHGDTAAFLAQAAKNGFPGGNGVGNFARFVGLSVQDLQTEIDLFCAGM